MPAAPSTLNITSRQTKVLELLWQIADANLAGAAPSKADLCRGKPTKTRAGDYQRIDTLIGLGLVENVAVSGAAYALRVTADGITELDGHNVKAGSTPATTDTAAFAK